MSLDRIVPERGLTEEDVVSVLRRGDRCSEWLAGRRERFEEARLTYEELIKNAALRSSEAARPPGGGDPGRDSVYYAWQDANRMLREEAAYLRKQQRNIHFAGVVIRHVWDSFYHMDPDLQDILRRYYIRRQCVQEIAEELAISPATFWRRRKKAVSLILRECSERIGAKRCVD